MTKRSLLAVLLLLGFGAARVILAAPPIDLQGARVVDLTHPFDDKTIYWPTSPSAFQLNRLSYGKTEGGWFYASNSYFPSYGAESARYLVEQRKVGALGVDTASIDHGPSKDFIVHQIAMGANVPGLENVAHLEELPETGAWVIALPMKIAGGSGGPVRIVALVPKK